MKNFAIKFVWFTALVVFATTILAQTSVDSQIFLFLIITVPLLIMYMVYRVLKDNYHTNQTFKNWYADSREKRMVQNKV